MIADIYNMTIKESESDNKENNMTIKDSESFVVTFGDHQNETSNLQEAFLKYKKKRQVSTILLL